LLTAAACLGGLVLLARRGQQAAGRAARPGAGKASIVVAGHDRLVVICSRPGDTVYVLRPPGADPRQVLRVARLVLPADPSRQLAEGGAGEGGRGADVPARPRALGVSAGALPGPRGSPRSRGRGYRSGGSCEALFRSDSTSAATCRLSSGVSWSMVAVRSALSPSPRALR